MYLSPQYTERPLQIEFLTLQQAACKEPRPNCWLTERVCVDKRKVYSVQLKWDLWWIVSACVKSVRSLCLLFVWLNSFSPQETDDWSTRRRFTLNLSSFNSQKSVEACTYVYGGLFGVIPTLAKSALHYVNAFSPWIINQRELDIVLIFPTDAKFHSCRV